MKFYEIIDELFEDPTIESYLEEFKPIPDYPDYYVSDYGRILSMRGKNPRILKPFPNKKGYLEVALWKKGDGNYRYVHSLVAEAFLGDKPSQNHEVDHLNHIRTDNRACNLEWITHAENIERSMENILAASQKKVRCLETGEIFPSAKKASISLGLNNQAVSNAIYQNCRAGGFHWRYEE